MFAVFHEFNRRILLLHQFQMKQLTTGADTRVETSYWNSSVIPSFVV